MSKIRKFGDRIPCKLSCLDARCKPYFKDECDINMIMSRFVKSGTFDHLNDRPARYADVSTIGDYRDVLARVASVEEDFASLPSHVRKQFGNDPLQWVEASVEAKSAPVEQVIPPSNEAGENENGGTEQSSP